MMLVLFGLAGLALDAGHLYLVARQAQNAADAAALAAGRSLATALQNGPPGSSSNAAVQAGHDWAGVNGFTTLFPSPNACDTTVSGAPQVGLSQFATTWYDTSVPCGSTSGFNTRVTLYSPPQSLTTNCTVQPYNCLQVVVTQQVTNFLMGVLGQPVSTVTASASIFAQPPKGSLPLPPPVALYLYQPQSKQAGCNSLNQQCFDETLPPQRSGMSCKGALPNCPTLWVQPGSGPLIAGYDNSPAGDMVAVESNGDVVLQDATTICDPYGGATCAANQVTGSQGLALAAGTKLYCSGFGPGSTSNTTPPCTTTGQAPLGTLYANDTSFSAKTWAPTVNTSLPVCGALILNGDNVTNSFSVTPSSSQCYPSASEPYTILPGQYQYIVVNHGAYDVESGLYLITGTAPINTNLPGTLANGIDHSQENVAPNTDWDLCTASPCTLTAGVWIGHGSSLPGSFVPAVAGTNGFCTGGGGGPKQGGGGDPTRILGNGVTLRLDSNPSAGGFVSTHEVDYIALISPISGSLKAAQGVPLLFDLENDNFIHLDASGNGKSRFQGILYQYQNAKAGGVEMNPGLAGGRTVQLGQVWAYSFTTFGTPGFAIDFTKGVGGATSGPPIIGGRREQEIFTGATLSSPKPGYETVQIQYADEWALDAYNAYVRINYGLPVYFSQGIWVGTPSVIPPNPNTPNPSDANPAYPTGTEQGASVNYTITTAAPPKPDWTYNFTDGTGSTFRIYGDWVWGHEKSITGAAEQSNTATLEYMFPTPPGTQVVVELFMSDGDRCGDWATAQVAFNNIGQVNPGQQTIGTVRLEQ
jgi:Flp pilus assembly protein TadG